MTGLKTSAIRNDIVSHALRLGVCDQVNQHESENAPGNGMVLDIFADYVGPYRSNSGLSATSAFVVFNARFKTSILQEPRDDIDGNLEDAVDALFAAYHADFTLGGDAWFIDLLGATRQPLEATFGYFEQAANVYRAVMTKIPVIVEDAWPQTPTEA